MNTTKKTLALGASALLAIAGVASDQALASVDDSQADTVAQHADPTKAISNFNRSQCVIGQFQFSQTETLGAQEFRGIFSDSAKHLCASDFQAIDNGSAEDWSLSIKGAVGNAFSASAEELQQSDAAESKVMGCSCAGNPSDGLAAANALVSGLSLNHLIETACPQEGANTLVVSSQDGYTVALPLDYVRRHHCLIVSNLDGEPLSNSVGGYNQLWLGSTAASYYVKNVTTLTLEVRQTPPPSPTSPEARAASPNLPNIGILFGGNIS